jgi:hypothetical protein
MDCFSPECKNAVVYNFTWGWGTPAACCADHRVHAQQIHDAQERGKLTFVPIDPDAVKVPLGRDERTQLIAAKMSAELDGDQVRARAAELFNLNTELQAEVRRLRARDTESQAQLKDRAADVERLLTERDDALASLHETRTELERITLLVPREAPETPRDRHTVG